MEAADYWLIAGAVFLAFEAFAIPGIGFLFAGLAAILTGVIVKLGVTGPNIYTQFAWFFGLTVVWTAILWKKLKSFRLDPKGGRYDNMVGTTATVHGAPLTGAAPGQVKWSDAVMNAELKGSAELPVGALVTVTEVRGNTLIVKPKE